MVQRNAGKGRKDVKLPRFGLIPPYPMWEIAKVYGKGSEKYAPRNWEQGISFTVSLDALERHIQLFKAGQDKDPESGLHHLAHAAFHLFALMQNGRTHPELDDRSEYYMALNMDSETLVQESNPGLVDVSGVLGDPLDCYVGEFDDEEFIGGRDRALSVAERDALSIYVPDEERLEEQRWEELEARWTQIYAAVDALREEDEDRVCEVCGSESTECPDSPEDGGF